MTTIINVITTQYAGSSPYNILSDGMAVISVALLLTLLIEKVLLDAYEDRSIETRTKAITIIMVPMLFVLVTVVFLRLAQIIYMR